MTGNADLLRQVPLFTSLTPDQIAAIADRFRADHFATDTFIFLEGDEADRLWVIRDGQVKIVKYNAEGQENILEVILPGEMFGGAGILFPQHPATAVAMTDTTTLSINRTEYLQLIRQYPDIALRIIAILGERLRAAMHMRALSTERVDTRLAHILLKLCNKVGEQTDQGVKINLPLSRQDLADMTGTTIETAIRIMSKFRKDGLALTEPGGYIVVTDRERLQRLSAGDIE
ncbi:MAG: Crp/Fnr family transcriptional regulator [Anaerolineae bacterium]